MKGRLAESFSMLPGEAYSSFVKRRKRVDESVDAYLADLQRLLSISGHKEDGGGKDPMLMEQFLAGLPKNLADQLRLSNAATSSGLSIAAISNQARALCSYCSKCRNGSESRSDGRLVSSLQPCAVNAIKLATRSMIALDVDVRDQLTAPESSVMDAGTMDTTGVIALRPGTELRYRNCPTSQRPTQLLPAVRMTACFLVLLRVLVLPCLRFLSMLLKGVAVSEVQWIHAPTDP